MYFDSETTLAKRSTLRHRIMWAMAFCVILGFFGMYVIDEVLSVGKDVVTTCSFVYLIFTIFVVGLVIKFGYNTEADVWNVRLDYEQEFDKRHNKKINPITIDELNEKIKNGVSDFSNMNLYNIDLSNRILKNMNFNGSELFGCNFTSSTLENVNFEFAVVQDCVFTHCTMINVVAKGSHMTGCDIGSSNISNSDFSNANLYKSIFKNSIIKNTTFNISDICNVDFRNSMRENVTFDHTESMAYW